MSALDRLLQCNGNPVAFFELVDAAKAELDQIKKSIQTNYEIYLEMRTANDVLKRSIDKKDVEIKRLRNTLTRIKNGRGLWDENDMIRIAREELEKIP